MYSTLIIVNCLMHVLVINSLNTLSLHDALPMSLRGVRTPPRGDVLRPRRRRLASPPQAPGGADGAPRERGQGASPGPGAQAGAPRSVAAIQAVEEIGRAHV